MLGRIQFVWGFAWRIPGTEEPSGLPSMGSHRVGHDWSDLAAAPEELFPLRFTYWSPNPQHLTVWLYLDVGFLKRFCFTEFQSLDCVDHNKLWKILKEMRIPDHLMCLLRNLYASQEATVRTGHGTTDWFQIEKGVHQGCILSPCLFKLHAEYIMRNAGLEETQAGI